MDIWPIDFNKTLTEISKWFDEWRVERFGKESLDPERYYNTTDDGRYLYGVREGESLNDEKDKCDKVLELLISIKQINDKLSGKALSQHLQWREREQLKGERETLYKAFLDEVQTEPEQAAPDTKGTKAKGRPIKTFLDCMNGNEEEKANRLKRMHSLIDGRQGKDVSLYILAAISNGWITRPTYKQVESEFGNIGAKQGFNSYLHKEKFSDTEIKGAIEALYNLS